MSFKAAIIIPASNEEALIAQCLDSVCESTCKDIQVIVVANGCSDKTADVALGYASAIAASGGRLDLLDLAKGGKLNALNQGDALVEAPVRIYLDADVCVEPELIAQIVDALQGAAPRYASGSVRITARGFVSKAYAHIWRKVPFMRQGVPGCGVYAVNEAGRARWGAFPDIISDDTFVRLSFAPKERLKVPASYDWPIAEGWRALVKVRRRQDAGVHEIEARYPELLQNDDKAAFPAVEKLKMALMHPLGFLVYAGVAVAVKMGKSDTGWSRGR